MDLDLSYKKERRSDYLLMLVWHTVFFAMFAVVTFMLDWDKNVLIFITVILVACWVVHFTMDIPEVYKTWIFFLEGMVEFFFYGQHATSLWDMTAVYSFILFLYYRNRIKRMITISMLVYYFTLACNFLFESRFDFEISPLNIARLVLHCTVVYAASKMVKSFITKDLQRMADLNREVYVLEEKNNRTIDFLSNVSHELRTPINVITGTSTIALKQDMSSERRLNILFMQEAGYKLFSLVDEILDYAEISSSKVILFEENYMFLSLANDIISDSRNIPVGGNVEVIFDIDTAIPAMLSGDAKKIKKVIRLLIDNAIKFTNLGAVYVKAEALQKSYGVNLRFEVRDTGKGIKGEDIAKISSGFYQGNSGRNRSTGGLGLGLSIAYGLVSSMNGFIKVESEVDKGTTFMVSIPQRVVDAAPAISFEERLNITVGLFIRTEKYSLPEVKLFYNETILHMVRNFEVPVHRVFDLGELKKLVEVYELTHLFLGTEEFGEDREYFESLTSRMTVTVIADTGFVLPPESAIKIVQKPLWVLPVLNVLDITPLGDIKTDSSLRMICPGVKILVVDDEPMNLMITEGLLKDYQMKISFAQSGREALEFFEQESFDIIFLDHMMPEMDGVETMRRLKMIASKSGKVLRVVAFTANVISSARETFIKEGFSEFLSKPVEITELERVLKKVLPDTMISYVPAEEAKAADGAAHESPDKSSSAGAAITAAGGEEKPLEPAEKKAGSDTQDGGGLEALAGAGINTAVGLGYCRGDEGFYRELLLKFAEDAPSKQEKIEGFYKSRDWDNYRILVHALKSTSKMIGADSLSEAAKALENASKNNDGKYIKQNHTKLMKQYTETTEAISGALGKPAGVVEGEAAQSGAPESEGTKEVASASGKPGISKEDFVQKLNELKGCFATFEADKALELIDSMAEERFSGKPVLELLKGIRQDIDDFDFSAAAEKLEGLVLSVEEESK